MGSEEAKKDLLKAQSTPWMYHNGLTSGNQ